MIKSIKRGACVTGLLAAVLAPALLAGCGSDDRSVTKTHTTQNPDGSSTTTTEQRKP